MNTSTAKKESQTLAPGARIVVRDTEWLVRSLRTTDDGVQVLEVVGVSDFIKGKPALFIKSLEEDLQVLAPEDTQLVADASSGYQNSLLFIEAHLRQTAPTDGSLYVGHRGALDVLPFQLEPALKALNMPRPRLLIADTVGLGKTAEAGILVSELIRRGRAQRILVVTTKSMLSQFQKEFWGRFTIPLVRLDSVGIQRIRSRIPTNHNPFHYYDRSIVSVDTLKQDREYRTYIEQAYWDVIVIDEAHNVARRGRGTGASQRSKLAERLASRSDALIMLSATPHDGRAESFASLMNMLDPTAIADEHNYTRDDIQDLYVRRFKKDVKDQLAKHFPERQVQAIEVQASVQEERAFEILADLKLSVIDAKKPAGSLFKTTILKAMLSSPMACLETLRNRIARQTKAGETSSQSDIQELDNLACAIEKISSSEFAKYQRLLTLITENFAWTGRDTQDRLVIFTERLETMRFLATNLERDLKLPKKAVSTLDGGMSDVEQMGMIESFGDTSSPLRLLIATDVASEGINLHYLCHRLIHFDTPWSLMALQQRNGRIDRYGQEQQPQIRYMLTRSHVPRMDEVERIIKVLLDKDEQAVKNIGDPSVFMGVFDIDEEIRVTATAIESGQSAADFAESLEPSVGEEGFDFFALLDEMPEVGDVTTIESHQQQMPSLFDTDYKYVVAALEPLVQTENLQLTKQPNQSRLELTLTKEMRQRFDRLPREVLPTSDSPLVLCADKQVIFEELKKARSSEERWPAVQYLWELHPLLGWLNDRGMTIFGRHQAPVISLSKLAADEVVFAISGVIPNRRGQPLINCWLGVVFKGGKFSEVEDFTQTLNRTHIGSQPIPNRALPIDPSLDALRFQAVAQARDKLIAERKMFEAQIGPQLEQQRQRLGTLRRKHDEQLELRFQQDGRPQAILQDRKTKEQTRIDRIFTEYQRWIELSMTTEPVPYLKIVAVFKGEKL